jgi:hypothetical protein
MVVFAKQAVEASRQLLMKSLQSAECWQGRLLEKEAEGHLPAEMDGALERAKEEVASLKLSFERLEIGAAALEAEVANATDEKRPLPP